MGKFSRDETFSSIDEELSWCAFKMTGNPDIMRDMINERYNSKEETLGLGK